MPGADQHIVIGDPPRVVDIDNIEALVKEVIDARDPAVIAAAQKVVRLDRDPDPDAAIRDAVLVFYRNGRRFDSVDALVAATGDRLDLRSQVVDVDWDADVADIAATHPERGQFARALDGRVDPSKIDALWELVVEGVRYQKALNDADAKHDPNPHYQRLAEELETLLAVAPGDMPALWSGGYDVSMYAQNAGFRTLEVTEAGQIFDQLKLFRDFSTLGPLWDGISRKFVASFGGEIHVFVRTMDKDSTLFRQELAELHQLEGVVGVRWHVMQGSDLSNLTPIDGSGRPAPGHTFDGFRDAAGAMDPGAFRAPDGDKAIPGEPTTPDAVRDRMVNEQVEIPRHVAALNDFVDQHAAALGVDGPAFQAELARLKARAELRLKNDPALGVELAALHAEIEDDLAKAIADLARRHSTGS